MERRLEKFLLLNLLLNFCDKNCTHLKNTKTQLDSIIIKKVAFWSQGKLFFYYHTIFINFEIKVI